MAREIELTVIRVFDSRMAAEITMSLLRSEGFDACVWADDGGGAFPGMFPGVSGRHEARLVVPEDQAEAAHRFLSEKDARGGLTEKQER